LASGCEEEVTATVDVVRTVKTMVVETLAGQQARRISGVVESDVVSDLSFEVGGRIVSLAADIGDAVEEEQEIARLDQEPYRLQVQTAESELAQATARLRDAQEKYNQQATLFEQGFATKTSFDGALADYEAAQSSVAVAQTQLEIASRDLRNTILRAPFSGRVAERAVENFTEVGAGQKIVQIHDETTLNVEVSAPETLVSQITRLDPVTVVFPTLDGLTVAAQVTDIGARALNANAFTVKVALSERPERVRPGMTAEVIFEFANAATGQGFVLPNTALLPSGAPEVSFVFVFDHENQVVRQREVQVISIRDNDIAVSGDIEAGDIVVVAGVSFLADNMEVRLLEEAN
jgi:RND family efflux transporter MFP subunit